MEKHQITLFKPFPFEEGQKIRIEGGKRHGDWEVIGVSESKVTLRCPVSGRQFEWDHFCYMTKRLENQLWPTE
jgi:hypothetical protein